HQCWRNDARRHRDGTTNTSGNEVEGGELGEEFVQVQFEARHREAGVVARKHGPSCKNSRAVAVVDGDGALLRTDYPDAFGTGAKVIDDLVLHVRVEVAGRNHLDRERRTGFKESFLRNSTLGDVLTGEERNVRSSHEIRVAP